MTEISVYNLKGEEVEKMQVSDEIFALPENDTLVHQVYVALLANIRGVYAHTKTRGEVSGSGKKPWKQKGTGRARVGSVRNPVWRTGGTVFGPRNVRNFVQKINQKMRRKAVKVALSGKIRDGKLIVVENFSFSEEKTKYAAKALHDLKVFGKSVLASWSVAEKAHEKVTRNIPRVTNILADNLNVADILNHQYILMSRETVRDLETRLLAVKNEEVKMIK